MADSTTRVVQIDRGDVEKIHKIWIDSFQSDSHTLFKMYEKGTTDMSTEMPIDYLHQCFDAGDAKGKTVKCLDAQGEILGWASWGYWNFNDEHPKKDDDSAPEAVDAPIHHPDYPDDPSLPPLKRMGNLTSGHLMTLQHRLCPNGEKVIYCRGISVDPSCQSHGVGTALIKWATDVADANGASMWNHLSDNANGVRAFEKNGFKVVAPLTVDLDAYREKELPTGKDKWGIYTFSCMTRSARTST